MKLPRRFSGSPMKPRRGGVAPARKRRPANSAAPPRLVARGKDGVGSLYEVEGEDCGELHEGQEAQEPLLYRFVATRSCNASARGCNSATTSPNCIRHRADSRGMACPLSCASSCSSCIYAAR